MTTRIHSVRKLLAIVGGAASVLPLAPASGQIKFTSVALSGQQAPGAPAGSNFLHIDLGFGFPYINNQGRVAFRAFLTGPGVTTSNDAGIWCGPAGGLALVAREGQGAPETSAGVLYDVINGPPSLSGDGRVAIRASLIGSGIVPGVNDQAVWCGLPGGLAMGGRRGMSAPGTGSVYSGFGFPAVNSFGQLAVDGTIDTPVFNFGLWFGAPGSVTKLALQGDPAPGFGPGVNYSTFTTSSTLPSVQLNSAGQVAFLGRVGGPGIGAANDDALWAGTPGSLHVVARAGNPAPGTGALWNTFESPVLTDSGAVAFRGFLGGAGVTSANDFGLWRGFVLGVLDLVVREGDGAPGTTLGTVFSNLALVPGPFGIPKMNNANGMAFRAQVSGPAVTSANDVGIWAHNSIGALVLIAREGDPAPELPPGSVFTSFNANSPVHNNLNQVAFMAAAGATNGIWATDPYGAMHLVARDWQSIEVDPGVFRTIVFLHPITGRGVQDGSNTSFNDRGQIVLRADFGTDSGIIIADVNDQCRPTIADHPDPQTVSPGAAVSFSVGTTGPGTHAYQWRRDGAILVDGPAPGGGSILGATRPTLELTAVGPADAGVYDVQVTNLCGTRTSTGATLTVGCYANCDGSTVEPSLNVNDFICFQSRFAAGDAWANCDGSTGTPLLNVNDFICFQSLFAAGCP